MNSSAGPGATSTQYLNLTAANHMTLPEAALYYRRAGLAIVPTRLNPKGKHAPYHKGWQSLRLTEKQVQEHWSRWPNDGIGLRVGIDEAGFQNIHVIDLDTRPEAGKNGKRSFKAICPDAKDWIKAAPYATTPSDGVHVLVKPTLSAHSINQGDYGGIDLLATGVIIVSPTTRPDGRYTWKQDGVPVAPPPAILSLPAAIKTSDPAGVGSPPRAATIYPLRDVDLASLPITTELKHAILSGDASVGCPPFP